MHQLKLIHDSKVGPCSSTIHIKVSLLPEYQAMCYYEYQACNLMTSVGERHTKDKNASLIHHTDNRQCDYFNVSLTKMNIKFQVTIKDCYWQVLNINQRKVQDALVNRSIIQLTQQMYYKKRGYGRMSNGPHTRASMSSNTHGTEDAGQMSRMTDIF